MSYEMVARNFERGLWSLKMVWMAVRKGVITREEYQKLTGKEYSPYGANK